MRTAAREAALNIIYAQQFNSDCLDLLTKKIYKQLKLEKEEDVAFADALISTVTNNRAELMSEIENACHHYTESRMNPVDKSILLIAMAEIKYFDEIPAIVSVSEATGLAKKYSAEKSADFVNGVLAGIINPKEEGN